MLLGQLKAKLKKLLSFKRSREVVYDMNFIKDRASGVSAGGSSSSSDNIELDELYEDAKEVVLTEKKLQFHIFKEDLESVITELQQ